MTWTDGSVCGCHVQPLRVFADERGWLAEVFRQDEMGADQHPVMAYLSMTRPGVTRGPHEHVKQTDLFVFFSGRFRLYLWDTRPDSSTFGVRQVLEAGAETPVSVLVPPGVVHAYRNIGEQDALILNCPNALYAGEGKSGPVDEIRHEDAGSYHFPME